MKAKNEIKIDQGAMKVFSAEIVETEGSRLTDARNRLNRQTANNI